MFLYIIRKAFRNILINIMGPRGEQVMRKIWCVQRCKGLRDLEFYEIFSRHFGHYRVL